MHHLSRNPAAANDGAPVADLAGALIGSENIASLVTVQEPVTISLAGVPQRKGRARTFFRGGHVGHYTPAATRSYEGIIPTMASRATGNRLPFDQPIELVLRVVFPVPFAKPRNQAIVGEIKPGKKPDLDNIAKAWSNALNGVVFRDNALITRAVLEKIYGPQPLVVAMVRAAR